MARTVRKRLSTEERRRQLLEVGAEVFSARPYDEVTVEEIAGAAGISTGLLYHYFAGKQELLLATIAAASDEIFARTEPDPQAEPIERVRAGVGGHLDYVASHSGGYLQLMQPGADPEVKAVLAASRRKFVARMIEGITKADPPPASLVLACHGWIGFIEAVSVEWLAGTEMDADELRELLVKALIGLLGAVAQADPSIKFDAI